MEWSLNKLYEPYAPFLVLNILQRIVCERFCPQDGSTGKNGVLEKEA